MSLASRMAEPKDGFIRLLTESVTAGTLVKLTLGAYRGGDPSLRNLHVRPVTLRAGPHLSFVWRHATRDITKNHPPAAALDQLAALIGGEFGSAHLFTTLQDIQLELPVDAPGRLKVLPHAAVAPPSGEHDHRKDRPVPPTAPWLARLGITNPDGGVRASMAAKFRQINRFVELLAPLVAAAPLPAGRPVEAADMGCGKGYLTFATWQYLHDTGRLPAHVRGVEQRTDLVDLCNRTARELDCAGLEFTAGTIADAVCDPVDLLIALHACDTATDDAIARGVTAGAAVIVVAPCCHQELSPRLRAPPALGPALRHGIFHERQAEFVTDALRTLLLDWAGYETSAFEFVPTEHTPKNLMIAAVRRPAVPDREGAAARVQALAAAYGIRRQHLADRLGFPLQ